MLEKYITPLLMSYVDKYIKNLSPSDLGVSLWGGDVLLKNLELKLDVLEEEFLFPVRFLSGRIHELKIHIPWTSLGSDSVVITLNTLECSLTYKPTEEKDIGTEEVDKESDSGISENSSQQSAAPSYVQLLTQRILNNVEIHVNNLIFKYIEDDIVLSVNIKSACMYTVNTNWEQEFADVATPDYYLRRVVELVDLTICLDHSSASGRIEVYEEPVLYRGHITCRSLFAFPNSYSFSPSAIHVHVLCDDISLNISDKQFPALIVLLRRLMYLTTSSDTTKQVVQSSLPPVISPDEEGWVGWGWSMLGMASYDDQRASPLPPSEMLFDFSLFVNSFNITCTQVLQHKRKRSAKYQFIPFLTVHIRGLAFEYIAKGYYYSQMNLGISSVNASLSHHNEQIFVCGDSTVDTTSLTENSLFDTKQLLAYEDKKHANEDETLQFTKFRALWLSLLNVIPEFKQRPLVEIEQAELLGLHQPDTELSEIRLLCNKCTLFLNNSIFNSLLLFLSSNTMAALFGPMPAVPHPKKAVSSARLNVMTHQSITLLGASVYVSGSNLRETDGTHEVCVFYTCAKVDMDQHSPLWVSQLTKLGPQSHLTNKLCYCNYAIRITDTSLGFCSVRNLKTLKSIVILPPTFVQTVVQVYCFPHSWASTMQGLLEVRLEIPLITPMLTMPQIVLLSHFVNYWSTKLSGDVINGGDFLHGIALKTLAEHALKIEDQLSVEVNVSNIGIKFCRTSLVNSVMLTIRGCELFLYKSVDEAVCVLSGPYLTHDIYKSLDQTEEVHVVPALFSLTVQYPHTSFHSGSSPSDRPVVILHSSGVVLCWDRDLPRFLAYQPPLNTETYVRSCSIESPSIASSLTASSANAASFTAASSHHPYSTSQHPLFSSSFPSHSVASSPTPLVFPANASSVNSPVLLRPTTNSPALLSPASSLPGLDYQAPSKPPTSEPFSPGHEAAPPDLHSNIYPDTSATNPWWGALQYPAVQVNISPIVILLTTEGYGCPQGDIIEYTQNTRGLEALLVSLPGVSVINESTTCGLINPQELPLSVTTTCGLVGVPHKYSSLPWKISLSNLAVATVSNSVSEVLNPLSLEVTLGLGSRGSNDICLHADTHPVNVSINVEQILLLMRVMGSLCCDEVTQTTDHVTSSTVLSAAGSEVSSVHTYLPDVNTFSEHLTDHVGEEVSGHATSPPFVYVWLQYAVPKVTITLNDIVRLHAEDITASVDLEGLLLSKKLKIGSLTMSIIGEEDVSLISSTGSDGVVSVVHCNNYMRAAQPYYYIKIKPIQVMLDLDAIFKLTESIDFTACIPNDDADKPSSVTPPNSHINTLSYPNVRLEATDMEIICPIVYNKELPDNQFVCHVTLVTINSNPDNLLSRVIVDRPYHDHIKYSGTHIRCNYQLQLEVSGLEIYTERSKVVAPLHPITNAAEAWSKRRLSSEDDVTANIVQGLELRVTYAPPVTATRDSDQVVIYGSSFEAQLDPTHILLSLDQIELLLCLGSLMSRDKPPVTSFNQSRDTENVKQTRSTKAPTNPPSQLKLESYEAMVAAKSLKILIYRRSMSAGHPPQMFGILECSIEQGVVSACSVANRSEIRSSVYTAKLSLSTESTGVTYDGDMSCPVQVMSTVSPDSHTPFLTLYRETTQRKDSLTVEIKHDVVVDMEVRYLEILRSVLNSIPLQDRTDPTTSVKPSPLPNHASCKTRRIKCRLGAVSASVKSTEVSFRTSRLSSRADINVCGVLTDVAKNQIFSPFDVQVSVEYDHVTTGNINGTIYIPCIFGRVGQQHLAAVTDIGEEIASFLPESSKESGSNQGPEAPSSTASPPFTVLHHDDVRSAGYEFIMRGSDKNRVLKPETVVFSANEPAAITWRYPEKRMIVSMVTLPLLLACENSDGIQCTLRYLDEFTKKYITYAEFVVSQVDVATFTLPLSGIAAYQWRLDMELDLEIFEESGTADELPSISGQNTAREGTDHSDKLEDFSDTVDWNNVEVSSYPALTLAGCLCVDSLSTRVPNITLSLRVDEAELVLLHQNNSQQQRLQVDGYPLHEAETELELLKVTANNLTSLFDKDLNTSIQVACSADLHYLDYSILLYTLLARTHLHASLTSRDVSRDTWPAARDETTSLKTAADITLVGGPLCHGNAVSLSLSQTSLYLTPQLLTSLNILKTSWIMGLPVSPFETYFINETSHPAQLMINGSRYLSCPALEAVPCYWNAEHPVFVALETVHPSWSDPLHLKPGTIVQDGGIFVIVEQDHEINYIKISGGLRLNNNTVLDLQVSFLPLDPIPGQKTSSYLRVHDIASGAKQTSYYLGEGEHGMSFATTATPTQWSQPVRLHRDLPECFIATLSAECYIAVSHVYNSGHITVSLEPLFVVRNNLAEELFVSLSSPDQGIGRTMELEGCGKSAQVFHLNGMSFHNIGCKLDETLPLSLPVCSISYKSLETLPPPLLQTEPISWPSNLSASAEVRNILIPHNQYAEWSIEGQIRLSAAPTSKYTVFVDWWPVYLVHNNTSLTFTVRGSHGSPPMEILPGQYRSAFNLKSQLYLGVIEPGFEGVAWSSLVDITPPDGSKKGEVFKEVEVTGQLLNCHVIVHAEYSTSTRITLKPSLVLQVKVPGLNIRVCETVTQVEKEDFATELYWWSDHVTLQMAYKQLDNWSYPIDLMRVSPRKGVNAMSDKPCSPVPIVVCSVDHAAATYISIAHNPSPQIYLTNYSEFEFVVGEKLPDKLTVSSFSVDGDRTVLLRPFRSSYFDPFSTTEKLFIQEMNEDDFIPQLAFAFYKHSNNDSTPINSHKVSLKSITQNQSQNKELIKIDDDNKIAICLTNEGSLVKVTIMSEFMVDIKSVDAFDKPTGSPTVITQSSSPVFNSIKISDLNLFIFSSDDILASQIKLNDIKFAYEKGTKLADDSPSDRSTAVSMDVQGRDKLTFAIDDIQIDNCLRDQTYDYPVVMFTDKAVRTQSTSTSEEPFINVTVTFNNSRNTRKHSIHEFNFQMGKIHVHLEDVFLYRIIEMSYHYSSRFIPRDLRVGDITGNTGHVTIEGPGHMTSLSPDVSHDIPNLVSALMNELYEPLTAEFFSISDIEIDLGVHASIKLFLAADKVPLRFKAFRVQQLFTLVEHFSQVILARYASEMILQAGWVLASLDILGSPGLMIRSTLSGVKDLVNLPYEGLTRGPTAFVGGIAAGSASLFRNIGTGVITSVTNLAVSISRNMDRMSLDDSHTQLCAIHRRSYKASHVGTGLSKGLTGLGLHLLSAVAGIVQHPLQDIGGSNGITGATKGLVTGVSKGLVGMVTKPVGGAAEFVANAGEGFLTGAGWILSPKRLDSSSTQVMRSDTRIRIAIELLQLSHCSDIQLIRCTLSPLPILLLASPDKIYLLLDSIIQCFNRQSVRFVFEKDSLAIYSVQEKGSPETTLDQALLEKINKMYSLVGSEPAEERSADLIAILPIPQSKFSLLKNILS